MVSHLHISSRPAGVLDRACFGLISVFSRPEQLQTGRLRLQVGTTMKIQKLDIRPPVKFNVAHGPTCDRTLVMGVGNEAHFMVF